jgi:hypothetical protein
VGFCWLENGANTGTLSERAQHLVPDYDLVLIILNGPAGGCGGGRPDRDQVGLDGLAPNSTRHRGLAAYAARHVLVRPGAVNLAKNTNAPLKWKGPAAGPDWRRDPFGFTDNQGTQAGGTMTRT